MVTDHHGACVDAWLKRTAQGLPPDALIAAFEAAFTALWRRAHQTLGDVTLAAIADRVLYVAAERYSILSALELGETGLRWEGFRQRAGTQPAEELVDCVRFVLVEFLTVLGKLTGEVLTAPLHAELDAVTSSVTLAGDLSGPDQASSSEVHAEDTTP